MATSGRRFVWRWINVEGYECHLRCTFRILILHQHWENSIPLGAKTIEKELGYLPCWHDYWNTWIKLFHCVNPVLTDASHDAASPVFSLPNVRLSSQSNLPSVTLPAGLCPRHFPLRNPLVGGLRWIEPFVIEENPSTLPRNRESFMIAIVYTK